MQHHHTPHKSNVFVLCKCKKNKLDAINCGIEKSYTYAKYLWLQNKKQLVCCSEPPPPLQTTLAILENVFSITSLKTTAG